MKHGNMAVVEIEPAMMEAYEMGWSKFEAIDSDDSVGFDFSLFADSATWLNTVLPQLRSMAGYRDNGHGTYTWARDVAVVIPGSEGDNPAEANASHSSNILDALIEAYETGAYDGVDGGTYDPDSAAHIW